MCMAAVLAGCRVAEPFVGTSRHRNHSSSLVGSTVGSFQSGGAFAGLRALWKLTYDWVWSRSWTPRDCLKELWLFIELSMGLIHTEQQDISYWGWLHTTIKMVQDILKSCTYSGTPLNEHPSKADTQDLTDNSESPDCPFIHFNT